MTELDRLARRAASLMHGDRAAYDAACQAFGRAAIAAGLTPAEASSALFRALGAVEGRKSRSAVLLRARAAHARASRSGRARKRKRR